MDCDPDLSIRRQSVADLMNFAPLSPPLHVDHVPLPIPPSPHMPHADLPSTVRQQPQPYSHQSQSYAQAPYSSSAPSTTGMHHVHSTHTGSTTTASKKNPDPASNPKAASNLSPLEKLLASGNLHPKLASRYCIHSELGSGGFGFVLGATDTHLGKEVAVKFIIRSKVARNAWVHDQIYGVVPTEVYFLHHCRHPGIIGFVDSFHDDEYTYLIMEMHGSPWFASSNGSESNSSLQSSQDKLLPPTPQSVSSFFPSPLSAASSAATLNNVPVYPGIQPTLVRRPSTDLFECIEQFDCIPEATAKFIFKQVVESIEFLHVRRIVHRDIKDENIVIDSNMTIKIVDFGSAAVEPLCDPPFLFDRFQGTIQYASPEILRGEKYSGFASDIWALGILLYTILLGEVPFASSEQAKNGPYKAPRVRLSRESTSLLDWMLQKRPSRRPTATQVLAHPWFSP